MNQNNPNIHVIWSSDINIDDWKNYIEECWTDYKADPEMGGMGLSGILEEYFDNTEEPELDDFKDKYESDIYYRILEENDRYLDDERTNLNIQTEGKIICIANLGLWNGRTAGYKYMGNNINECLYSQMRGMSDIEFYVEKEGRVLQFKAKETHHDGTNYYTFRELKPELSDTQIRNFENKIYNGEATISDIGRYTYSLGEKIQKVYGFELSNLKDKKVERE